MKILYITTVGITMDFFIPLICEMKAKGHVFDIATNTTISDVSSFYKKNNNKIYKISCTRNPLSLSNIKAIREIKQIVKNGNYDIVHCHTPVASFCTRLACISLRKSGTKVIYTCHGFHFHKKSPFINWLIYYPAEKICSYFTDMIITINEEDYNVAKKLGLKKAKYIHGVGIDFNTISNMNVDVSSFRKKIGVPSNAFLLTSIGELSKRKNFSVVIDAIHNINDDNIYYAICGEGSQRAMLSKKIRQYGLKDRVILLGSKEHDFALQLCHASNVGIIPSLIEGLGLAGLEHMAAGKPVIGSNIHGIKDYVIDGETGLMCEPNNYIDYSKAIIRLMNNEDDYRKMSINAKQKAKEFDYKISIEEMKNNYAEIESFR